MPSVVAIMAGIKETLLGAASLTVGQDAGQAELTEGIPDTPLFQVYATEGDNEPNTFSAAVQRHDLTMLADVYVKERANVGEDMRNVYLATDEIIDILQAEQKESTPADPSFGILDGTINTIKSFSWRWEFVTFPYAGTTYVGIRFTLELMVY